MGKVWIQVCNSNPMARDPDLVALEHDWDRYHVSRFNCLDRCRLCERLPYVMLNGEPISASTCRDLMERIRLTPPLEAAPTPATRDPQHSGPGKKD